MPYGWVMPGTVAGGAHPPVVTRAQINRSDPSVRRFDQRETRGPGLGKPTNGGRWRVFNQLHYAESCVRRYTKTVGLEVHASPGPVGPTRITWHLDKRSFVTPDDRWRD